MIDPAAEKRFRALPFSEVKQDALLGHILQNEQFFLAARLSIKPEWFLDPLAARVYATKCRWYEKWGRNCTLAELKDAPEILKEDQGMINRLRAKMNQALHQAGEFGLDVLKSELTRWLHAKLYGDAIKQAVVAYNKEQFEEAFQITKQGLRTIDETTFEDNGVASFEDYVGFIERAQAEYADALTWGVELFDKLLTPEASRGCLLKGDTTVVLAPTNVGKTTTMLTVATHNIRRGKSVLILTHEGRSEDIQLKLWQAMLGVTKKEFFQLYTTPEGRRRLDIAKAYLTKFLVYKPMNQAGLTVEKCEPQIRRLQDERLSKTGKGFDLFIDDYPAKLSTELAKGGHFARRNMDEHIYNYFVQFALEMRWHSMVAIQTNREGSKVNRRWKGTEERLLTPEDVQESWGPMTSATNIVTINRDPLAQTRNRVTYLQAKNRGNQTNFAVVCRSRYEHALAHSDSLGATWYRGTSTMSDKIDGLLESYLGTAIPDTAVIA